MQWIAGEIMSQYQATQTVYDVVFAGELMDMAAGPLQLAVGVQRREDEVKLDGDKVSNDNDFKFILGFQDYEAELTTTAIFGELAVPVSQNLDVQLAVRYEDFDEIGESTTDPKIYALCRATESLPFRRAEASY